MLFEFSATIGKTDCYIRAYQMRFIQSAQIHDKPHKHYFMEFHCITSGEVIVNLPSENRQIKLTAGQILMIPRGVYHSFHTENTTVERFAFNFSADLQEKGSSTILDMYLNTQDVIVFENKSANSYIMQCRKLIEQPGNRLTGTRQGTLMLNAVLELFASIPYAQTPIQAESSKAMRQRWTVEQYIEQHFTDSDGIEGLAKALFLSPRQTRTLVRRFLGEDYKQIIVRRRMELAEIYMMDPNITLEDIAWQVGYKSYSGFQLSYKSFYGVTPSERRKQLLEQE
ncbi:MAG: helix-turn-helix domain-containing protein [Oscillospiraceae bacterium]|nr:helix-turn-helix domain-containing protein [Oscillospiraceae bacterium]